MKVNSKKKIVKNKLIKVESHVSFWEILKRFFVVWFLMFFCALVITQQESFWLKTSSSPEEVVFVLPGTPSQRWFDTSDVESHGAATDWSYLFEDEQTTQNNNQIPNWSPVLPSYQDENENLPIIDKDLGLIDKDLPIDEEDIVSETSWNTGNLVLSGNGIVSGGQTPIIIPEQICITTWGEYVAPGDFVLAYEQRKDVTNLCNVQRRYCKNGKLTGTYTQKSCKENTLYSYVKPEAISYSQKPVDPFVQPESPSLSWADFDTHGKINGTTDPIDTWWSPGSGQPNDTTSVSQTLPAKIQCVTPWWEKVPNGQFVKAYKSSIWLIDVPCDVELRLCVSGKLKWSYKNRTCTFKKMTYRDYMVQNYDTDHPTIGDLINTTDTNETQTTNNNRSFWQWLDKYF